MDSVKAVVQKVIPEGRHGPFAVATVSQLGSVTFSLEPTVWKEEEWPEEGMMVFLAKLRQKRAGWRAKEGRFWKPSDEQSQHTARSNQMEFLYPTSRQFPFDEVCERIVRELEQRNWQVPGITVNFNEYGSGEQKLRYTSIIKNRDFKIEFGRRQRLMDGGVHFDSAAVRGIGIPQRELRVYDDESGPNLYLYVGTDWERDRNKFFYGLKANSKLRGEPRIHLEYKGECHCGSESSYWISKLPHTHARQRPPLLVHTNDRGREYDPEGDEPRLFRTDEVMDEFRRYLEDVVLKLIVSHPIPPEKIDRFAESSATPMPEAFNAIFCFGEWRDAERIKQGKIDPRTLLAAERYGLSGSGYRLMSFDTRNDGTVPEVAYEGFLWCGLREVTAETPIEALEIPGHYRWSDREKFVFRLKPQKADGIYIADHAEFEKRRKKLMNALTDGRDRFTDAEVADFTRARARTIIPISQYKGGFGQPVVLINRELSFDEVELVSGPHEDRHGR